MRPIPDSSSIFYELTTRSQRRRSATALAFVTGTAFGSRRTGNRRRTTVTAAAPLDFAAARATVSSAAPLDFPATRATIPPATRHLTAPIFIIDAVDSRSASRVVGARNRGRAAHGGRRRSRAIAVGRGGRGRATAITAAPPIPPMVVAIPTAVHALRIAAVIVPSVMIVPVTAVTCIVPPRVAVITTPVVVAVHRRPHRVGRVSRGVVVAGAAIKVKIPTGVSTAIISISIIIVINDT